MFLPVCACATGLRIAQEHTSSNLVSCFPAEQPGPHLWQTT